MEKVHDKQSTLTDRQTISAASLGVPAAFFEDQIKLQRETIDQTVEDIADAFSPEALADILTQMTYCIHVLGQETTIKLSCLTESLNNLAYVNTLLCRLLQSKNLIKRYEMEIAALNLKSSIEPQPDSKL